MRLEERIERYIDEHGGSPSGEGWLTRCPCHEDSHPSLSVKLTEDGSDLRVNCFAGCDWKDVKKAFLGEKPWGRRSDHLSAEVDRDRINNVWAKAYTYLDRRAKPLRRYLSERGLNDKKYTDALRLHPNLYFKSDIKSESTPAVLALATDKCGRTTGIQRIYISSDGKKFDSKSSKRFLGKQKGSCIKFDDPEETLCLAEGPETALAVREATGLPTWSVISAAGFDNVEVPEFVKSVHIFSDWDKSGKGQESAHSGAEKLAKEGKKVFFHVPESLGLEKFITSVDWLDILNDETKGAEYIKKRVEEAKAIEAEEVLSGFEIISTRELLTEKEEETQFIVQNLLVKGGISLNAAKPKVGKSTLARYLVNQVSTGKEFLGLEVEKNKCLYFALEEKRSEIRRHFRQLNPKGSDDTFFHIGPATQNPIKDLERAIQQYKPGLVVIDPIMLFIRPKELADYYSVYSEFERVLQIARKYSVHICCVHHLKREIMQVRKGS
jgi:hypothetical protein